LFWGTSPCFASKFSRVEATIERIFEACFAAARKHLAESWAWSHTIA
jgi:hypothetical protein